MRAREIDLREAPEGVRALAARVAESHQPLALVDGDDTVAWVVPHPQYGRLVELAREPLQGIEEARAGRVAESVESGREQSTRTYYYDLWWVSR